MTKCVDCVSLGLITHVIFTLYVHFAPDNADMMASSVYPLSLIGDLQCSLVLDCYDILSNELLYFDLHSSS